jgi:tetratricopeptide (TPR) repeat protein
MAGKIFINYRREDSSGTAGRLHDRLAQAFGRNNLFMDVDHTPAGIDFVDYLHKQVAACDVFLAVIGPNWLDAKDDDGRRRFDKPDDFVTIEIAAALARNIRVIPVLVDGASMPKADKLPDSIKSLVRRNAVEIRNTHFGRDADELIEKIRQAPENGVLVPSQQQAAWLMARRHGRLLGGGAAVLLLVGWMALYQIGVPVWVPWTPAVQQQAPAVEKSKGEQQRPAAQKEDLRAAEAKAEEARRKEAEEVARQRFLTLMNQGDKDIRYHKYDDAIAALNEAIQLDSKNPTAYRLRGYAYRSKGDHDRAIADYDIAIRLDPKYGLAYQNRANAYSLNKEYDRAIADYDLAIQLEPKSSVGYAARGLVYYNKKDYKRALSDLSEATRLDPLYAYAFNGLGITYAAEGDLDRAIPAYNEAIRLNPSFAVAFGNRANAQLRKGNNVLALADYNEAVRIDPKDANVLCNRGNMKLRVNDASGNADIDQARQLNPSICRVRSFAAPDAVQLLTDGLN